MLSVLDVMNTCKDYVRPLREGEDLYKNGLLICAGITKKNGSIVECQGLATQVSHVHEHPHIINVKIDSNKTAGERIIEGKCSCIAGESAKCKHYIALLLHLSRTNEDDLDDLSCTDIEQQWGKLDIVSKRI
ncbi:uncharacterized protein LOC113005531 [Solenopsis invicta]|uniref:uncharacterized protein LOC113005531 n=1 Tax=Solenopsis invicta TaxID=13686 RepID=UPI000E33D96F|nr:uncharacterized protein LOC113005531 [Solenopsis invicta]